MNEYTANKRLPNNIVPRSARRARKPLQEDWMKGPGRGIWVKCTYIKCSFQWQYFGRRKWAECPVCHSVMRVAAAKRNFVNHSKASPQAGRKVKQYEKKNKNTITKD
jgi:hypothetical protein